MRQVDVPSTPARKAKPKRKAASVASTRAQVKNAIAQSRQYASQGAQVEHAAYLAAPVKDRRTQVAAARATTKRGMRRTGGQSLVLGTHGQRSADWRSGRTQARRVEDAYAGSTPAVLPTNHMDKSMFTRAELQKIGFTDFTDYTKRAEKGKLGKHELAVAKRITSTPSPDAFGKLAKAGLSGTSVALEQLMRPSSALGAAALDRTGGHSSISSRLHAAEQGFLHPGEHAGDWTGAAKAAGIPAPIVAGTVASIATDPTTYLTLGAGTPAKALAMHAFERELAASGDHLAATAAAREAWNSAPAHLKAPGIKLGVRGTPARLANRSLRGTPVHTAPLGGRVVAAAQRAGVKPLAGKGEAARTALNKLAPGVRPTGWHPVDWEIARAAATNARAAERGAGRKALARLTAYRAATKDWAPEQHAKVIHAIERGDLSTLSPDEANVATAAQKELRDIHQKEVAAGLLAPETPGTKIGGLRMPDAPAHHARHALFESLTGQSARSRAAAERTAIKAKAGPLEPTFAPGNVNAAVHAARAQAAGVPLTADAASLRRAMREVEKTYPDQFTQPLAEAHREFNALNRARRKTSSSPAVIEARDRAQAKIDDLLNARKASEVAADAAHAKAVKAFEQAPAGYFPRVPAPDSARQSIGTRIAGAAKISTPGRKELRALEHLDPAALSKYHLSVPEAMAKRVQQHERRMGASGLNERIASLGAKVDVTAEDVAHLAGKPGDNLFVHTPRGLTPLFDKHGLVDGEALAHEVKLGHDIVQVDPQQAEAVRFMASGQRGARDGVDHLALGGTPGEAVGGVLGRAQRSWKFAVTAPNIAYHVRNLAGDLYNARLGDAGVGDLKAAARLRHVESQLAKAERDLHTVDPASAEALSHARQHVEDYRGRHLSDVEVVGLAQKHGAVQTGYVGAELRRTFEGQKVGVAGRAADRIARASAWREDIVRLATFHGALKRGMSPEEAARWSLQHHFDYSELSRVEQTWLRNVIPFYTFTARNLPLQVKSLATRPGVVANVDKVRRATLEMAGTPAGVTSTLPEYQQQSPPWGTPFGVNAKNGPHGHLRIPITVNPNLPISSLGMVPPLWLGRREGGAEALKNIGQQLSPLIKLPIEAATGRSMFTGAKIKDRVEAPSLPGIGTILGGHKIRDERSGKMVSSWPGWLTELLGQTQYTGQIARAGTTSKTGQPEDQAMRLANLAGVPGARGLDPRVVRIAQLYRENQKLQNQHDDLAQRDPHHKSGTPWPKTSPVYAINQRIGHNQGKIDGLTAHIQGHSAPKRGAKRSIRGRLGQGPASGGFASGGFGGGGFGG